MCISSQKQTKASSQERIIKEKSLLMHKIGLMLRVLWITYYSLNTAVQDTANRRHVSKQVYYLLPEVLYKQQVGGREESKSKIKLFLETSDPHLQNQHPVSKEIKTTSEENTEDQNHRGRNILKHLRELCTLCPVLAFVLLRTLTTFRLY